MADDDEKDNGPIEDQPANENLTPDEQQALGASPSVAQAMPQSNANNAPETTDNESVEPVSNAAPTNNLPQQNNAPKVALPNAGQFIDQIANPTAQEMDQHALEFYNDIANRHIKPKTYNDLFDKKDTVSQLGLAFSILMGGIGSGLTHQSNAALDMMNKVIDRDFEAQKLSKENANNFLRTEYEHQLQLAHQKLINAQAAGIPIQNEEIKARTGDIKEDAKLKSLTGAKNAMQLAVLAGPLTDLVNNLPNGQLKQTGQQALSMVGNAVTNQVQTKNAQTAAQLSARGALRNSGAQLPNTAENKPNAEQQFATQNKALRYGGMENIANANEEHHFPGLGDTSQTLTPNDRENINSGISFQNELQGFTNWARAHSGSLNPAEINEGKALAAQLQSAYRQATNGGVYKEGEQNFISKIITDEPTKFFNEIRSIPQLTAVQRESNAQLNQHLKSLGFQKKPQFQPTWSAENAKQKQQAPMGEGGIPPDGTKGMYKGKPYTWKNGKKVID